MGDGPERPRAVAQAPDATRSTRRSRRLGTDYVDLYQIHRFDPDTPIEETLEALHDIVKAGKARYIGASSMCAWQFAKMLVRRRSARLDAVRLDAEPLQPRLPRGRARDDAALPRGGHRRHPVEPARARLPRRQPPQGGLAATRSRAKTDDFAHELYLRRRRLRRSPIASVELAARRGVKPAQVALAWLLAKPGVTAPIVGASKLRAPRRGGRGARRCSCRADDMAFLEAAVPAAPGARPRAGAEAR